MELSLNEFQMLAIKAAHGVGLEWGVAEDAGYASRWLASHNFDAGASLCRVLSNFQKDEYFNLMPNVKGENWTAQSVASSLLAGVRISDRPSLIAGSVVTIKALDCPLFMYPFLAHAAYVSKCSLRIEGQNFRALVGSEGVDQEGDALEGSDVVIDRQNGKPMPSEQEHTRANLLEEDLAKLEKWAAKTYAPASEASRLKGAGDGNSNDNE